MTTSQLDRFLSRIEQRDGCWIWTGYKMPNGYATIQTAYFPRRVELVHRVSYKHFVGEIPETLQIDHLCRNRACCNPTHLEAVTHVENMRRGLWGVLLTPERREQLSAAKRGRARPFPASARALYMATIQANRAKRTHCKHGHEYNEQTTRFTRSGHRFCATCEKQWRKKREAA